MDAAQHFRKLTIVYFQFLKINQYEKSIFYHNGITDLFSIQCTKNDCK